MEFGKLMCVKGKWSHFISVWACRHILLTVPVRDLSITVILLLSPLLNEMSFQAHFRSLHRKTHAHQHLFYTKKGILQHGSAIGFKRSKCNYGKNCFKPWIWKYTVGISIIDVGLNGEILLTWLCCLVLVGTLHWESKTQTPTKELQSHFYMSCQRADLSFILQPCDLDIFS